MPPSTTPYADPTQPIPARVEDLLSRMTLAEKIGQMTQVSEENVTPQQVADFAIGSVLSGGGQAPTPNTPQTWAQMVRSFLEGAQRSRLSIPLIYGIDAVHGHNTVYGATIFPHNIGLGATRDPALVQQAARITALEMIATHIHWTFAPCLAVPQDIRWGRTYEGFSSDPGVVEMLGSAAVRGLQNHDDAPALQHPHAVLASAKHFVGDGGTRWGTTPEYPWVDWTWSSPDDRWSIDQGLTDVDEETLRAVHLPPYAAAIVAGAKNIMVSYSSWGGQKMHANKYLLTDVLKGELGFDGFLISDWMALDQLDPDYEVGVVTAINAGLDMVMVPIAYRRFINALTKAVHQEAVSEERIDDAVRRILTVKFELGLFERPLGDETLLPSLGGEAHRAVARRVVRKSLVLLKNEEVLPLQKEIPRLLVAGSAADDIGLQCGGWTIEWQGAPGDITPGTTLLEAVRDSVGPNTEVRYAPDGSVGADEPPADVGIVVLAEPPYAEGEGDRADLTLPADQVALLERVRPQCRKMVVVLYSGRPLIVTEHLGEWDAFVAAWLPGSEGEGMTDVLFGRHPLSGQLSFPWPRSMAQVRGDDQGPPLWPLGFGLR